MLTLLLMARNEGRILKRCIDSAKDECDALLVVDTGSEDDTREVAEACGATVVRQPWVNFGVSRTASLEAARGLGAEFVLALDADMRHVSRSLRDYVKENPAAG